MKIRVLLIEDSASDAALIQRELVRAGYQPSCEQVETFEDFERALGRGAWDVIVSDYRLPQFSGLEAVQNVRQRDLETPFILVSGTIGEEQAAHVVKAGADAYVLKDNLGHLGPAIAQALESSQARTESKQAIQRLTESERRFREMLENVDLIAVVLDNTGIVTFSNDCLLRLTGWQRHEVLGSDFFSKFVPESEHELSRIFFETIEDGTIPRHYQNPIRTRNGELRSIAWNNTVLRDPEGRVIGVASLGEDITERHRNEQIRDALARRNEAFVRALGEIVYDHDVPNGQVEWSGNIERCLGWSLAELGTDESTWTVLIHPEDVREVLQKLEQTPAGHIFSAEYRFRHKAGHYIWMLDRGVLSRDELGRIARVTGIMLDISDRRRSEEELRSRTAFTEALLHSSPDGILVVDSNGKTLLQNRRVIDLWQMPPDIAEDPDDARRVAFVMNRTVDPRRFAEKVAYLYDHPLERSRDEIELVDGTVLDRTSAPVRDVSGKYYGRVWFFHDVSEQKQAEQKIADALNFNKTILEASPVGIITYLPTGEVVSVNESAARLVGATVEQVRKTNFRHLESWRTSGLLEIAERVLHTGMEEELEVHFVTTFGKEVWLTWRFATFQHEKQVHLLVVFADIYERKKSEAALRETQTRFQQLAEHIREVFWMKDTASNDLLYISPGYEDIWGTSRETARLSRHGWIDSVHPEDRERILHAVQTKQELGQYDETFRIIRPDGSIRWIRDRAFPIRNEAGEVYRMAGVADDITERRSLEEQFRQSQKLEAIGTLAGGIAHDFNNILAAICGFTDLAKMDAVGNPVILSSLDSISQASARAADLVRQILAFSRKQSQERKPIHLRHILNEALKLLRATLPSTIEFKIDLAREAQLVLADPTQVHQIIMNLGTNAAHAMQDRPGCLDVRLANFTVDARFAESEPGLRPGEYVRLSVSDTGHGMSKATIERIFEPFFTTKAPGQGTGLGLSVVHGIMQSHEGLVTVQSELGLGTVFHLYFPSYQTDESSIESHPVGFTQGQGERVLFLDDEPLLAGWGKKGLERLGYSVTVFTNPREAVEAVRARPNEWDIVITDFSMPRRTGMDVALELLKIRPGLPIILMTGYAASLSEEKVQSAGIRQLLFKPVTLTSLSQSLAAILQPRN